MTAEERRGVQRVLTKLHCALREATDRKHDAKRFLDYKAFARCNGEVFMINQLIACLIATENEDPEINELGCRANYDY
jgi:hypothetical protein